MAARILAIETAFDVASLAIIAGETHHRVIHSPDGYGHVLFGELQLLLDEARLRLSDIDCFAAGAGPGSFTGVRVALAAVKGFAEAAGKPLVAVSNLQAIAWFGQAPLRAALTDARRGQVYAAAYNADLHLLLPEAVTPIDPWLAALPPEAEILTNSPALHAQARLVPQHLAVAIAHIARTRYQQGLAQDPAAVDANYVRRSDAELNWTDQSR